MSQILKNPPHESFSRILPTNPLINLPHGQLFIANSSTRSLRSIVHWIASIRDYIKGVFLASHVVTGGVTEVWECDIETSKLPPRLGGATRTLPRQEDPATRDLFDELLQISKPHATSRKPHHENSNVCHDATGREIFSNKMKRAMSALNIVFSFPSCIIKNVSAINSSSIIIHDNHDIPFSCRSSHAVYIGSASRRHGPTICSHKAIRNSKLFKPIPTSGFNTSSEASSPTRPWLCGL